MGKPLAGLGVALIVAGALLLIYLGYTVFRAVDAPQEVALVKFIAGTLRVEDKAIYGHAGRDTFEINVSEPTRTVILLFLAAFVLMVFAGIAKALIAAGINLVSTAGRLKQQPDATAASSPAVRRE
jgi:threonine/homoserine/homoserine lactone efflux protein